MGATLDDYIQLVEGYIEQGLTDGLPVIPPSRARVQAMVEASLRDDSEVLGLLAPAYRELTVRDIAIYASMAGCRPDYMTVVVAALEVMMEPAFGLHHMATSTLGNTPMVVINGPIRTQIDINCGTNVLAPGARANATIGRAIRLIMINVGGAIPGLTDFACFGQGGKYTYVIGEDEEHSPWTPFHVDGGCEPTDSAVTVVGAGPPSRIGGYVDAASPQGSPRAGSRRSTSAEGFLDNLAATLASRGGFGPTGRSEVFLILCPEHREELATRGFGKDEIKRYLHEHSGKPAKDITTEGYASGDPDEWVPLFDSPQSINLIAAGGAGGNGSLIVSGQPGLAFGRHGQRVIRA